MISKYQFLLLLNIAFITFCISCNQSDRQKSHPPTETKYQLTATPAVTIQGMSTPVTNRYYYTINTETNMEMEVNGQSMKRSNSSELGLIYETKTDSVGHRSLSIIYDKIHLKQKNNDTETEMDADNAATSADPTEQLLGLLKGTRVTASIDTKGKMTNIQGYQQLVETIMKKINKADGYTRQQVQLQLTQLTGEDFIKTNLEQVAGIFPDTAVYIGDTWQTQSRQPGQIPMLCSNTYHLASVENGKMVIESDTQITADKDNAGSNAATADIKGKQTGILELDEHTRMLLGNTVQSSVKGTIQAMGREIPVTITTYKKMQSKKI